MNKEVIILELASLVRSLDFIQEGQAFIKTKLTDKLEEAQDLTMVNWAEDTHQQILNRELAIQLLKKDVQQLDRSLKLLSGLFGFGICHVNWASYRCCHFYGLFWNWDNSCIINGCIRWANGKF